MSSSRASTFATSLSVAIWWIVREVRIVRQWRLDKHFSTSFLLQETVKDLNPEQEGDNVKMIMKTRVGTSTQMDNDKNMLCTGTSARQRKIHLYILEASESGRNGGRGEWRSWTSRGRRERTRATVLQLASPGGEKSCKEKGKGSTRDWSKCHFESQ